MSCEDTALEVGHHATIDYSGLVDGGLSGGAGKDTLVAIGETISSGSGDGLVGSAWRDTQVRSHCPTGLRTRWERGSSSRRGSRGQERQVRADDEFAKDISTFDTPDELRADIRASQKKRQTFC